ncbi:MAG: hypothetical protein LUD51_04170, partial [Clostridia bacterium]|nr:hypothetical protein [Clostridia bacterium]
EMLRSLVGSVMCIRDSKYTATNGIVRIKAQKRSYIFIFIPVQTNDYLKICKQQFVLRPVQKNSRFAPRRPG